MRRSRKWMPSNGTRRIRTRMARRTNTTLLLKTSPAAAISGFRITVARSGIETSGLRSCRPSRPQCGLGNPRQDFFCGHEVTALQSCRGASALLQKAAAERQHYFRKLPRSVGTTSESCGGASALLQKAAAERQHYFRKLPRSVSTTAELPRSVSTTAELPRSVGTTPESCRPAGRFCKIRDLLSSPIHPRAGHCDVSASRSMTS
jgi:hypothetical protein